MRISLYSHIDDIPIDEEYRYLIYITTLRRTLIDITNLDLQKPIDVFDA